MRGLLDTDFERNVKRIRPLIGLGLVMAVAVLVFYVLNSTAQGLADALRPETPLAVDGTIRHIERAPYKYGETLGFRSTVRGNEEGSNTYVTTVCYQAGELVYHDTAKENETFTFKNDRLWGEYIASCSTVLMYRVVSGETSNVYLLDSVTYEVN